MTRSLINALGVATLVASFGIWGYAFSKQLSDDLPDPPDLLNDLAWAEEAEQVCARTLSTVEAMPGALDAADEVERADQLVATTAVFQQMVNELGDIPASTERDVEMTSGWLADWNILLTNRLDHAERLRSDPEAVLTISGSPEGERLDKRVTRFARTNNMMSCATPTDV